ncbi:MAG: adenylyltransferase [Candidatus Asgardarchaeum californiense]|nr:MAG: adenylyltransferase [Candidatus Asgardarchaeum californiense]
MTVNRYKKQILVEQFGKKGQNKLLNSKVVIIGAGGLGSNSANILTRAGVGSIEIVDDDVVDITNLHRTSIFNEEDVGKSKAMVLEKRLKITNSDVVIHGTKKKVTRKNIWSLIKNADIVLDGSDNMETRFLINDVCIKQKISWVYAGVTSAIGMVMGIVPEKTPCLRCISQSIPSPIMPSNISTFGIIPGVTASIQCMEAIKILLGDDIAGLIIYDIWKQQFEITNLRRNPECICCSKHIFEFL